MRESDEESPAQNYRIKLKKRTVRDSISCLFADCSGLFYNVSPWIVRCRLLERLMSVREDIDKRLTASQRNLSTIRTNSHPKARFQDKRVGIWWLPTTRSANNQLDDDGQGDIQQAAAMGNLTILHNTCQLSYVAYWQKRRPNQTRYRMGNSRTSQRFERHGMHRKNAT